MGLIVWMDMGRERGQNGVVDFVKFGYKIVIVILLNFLVLFLNLVVEIA